MTTPAEDRATWQAKIDSTRICCGRCDRKLSRRDRWEFVCVQHKTTPWHTSCAHPTDEHEQRALLAMGANPVSRVW